MFRTIRVLNYTLSCLVFLPYINDRRTNTSLLFYKCGILKFVDLIAYKRLIAMFKVKNYLLKRIMIHNKFHSIQEKVANLIKNMFALP